MATTFVRLYGELNVFLPPSRRQATLVCKLVSAATVKDLVEALGVPHTEIDHLVVNGRAVDFACVVRGGERVAAYPPFRGVEVGGALRLSPPPQADPPFVADVHLGRLAAYLRLAGFDVAYRNDFRDPELVEISAAEDRTLLTRDVGVLKHRAVRRGYYVRDTLPGRQLVEVLRRFGLAERVAPFTRCMRCNRRLERAPKGEVLEALPPRVREQHEEFSRCPGCSRVFWAGSHHARMRRFLEAAVSLTTHGD